MPAGPVLPPAGAVLLPADAVLFAPPFAGAVLFVEPPFLPLAGVHFVLPLPEVLLPAGGFGGGGCAGAVALADAVSLVGAVSLADEVVLD